MKKQIVNTTDKDIEVAKNKIVAKGSITLHESFIDEDEIKAVAKDAGCPVTEKNGIIIFGETGKAEKAKK